MLRSFPFPFTSSMLLLWLSLCALLLLPTNEAARSNGNRGKSSLDGLIDEARANNLEAVKSALEQSKEFEFLNEVGSDGTGQTLVMAATLAGATDVVR